MSIQHNRTLFLPTRHRPQFSNLLAAFSRKISRPSLAALQPTEPAQCDGGGILGRRGLPRGLLDDAESGLI